MLDKILISCSTKELAKELMEILKDLGVTLALGSSPKMYIPAWNNYKSDTVYSIERNILHYCYSKYYSTNNVYNQFKRYTAEEFIGIYKKNKIMTREDLKSGMLVFIQNEKTDIDKALLISRGNTLIGIPYLEDGHYEISTLKSNLSWDKCKIIKVYGLSKYPSQSLSFDIEESERMLLWERKEPKEYTMQEIANKLGIPVEELRIKK